MGFKIGGLSLSKVIDVNQAAEMAIKTSIPFNKLAVCAKLAESLLQGALLKNSLNKKFDAMNVESLMPLDIRKF